MLDLTKDHLKMKHVTGNHTKRSLHVHAHHSVKQKEKSKKNADIAKCREGENQGAYKLLQTFQSSYQPNQPHHTEHPEYNLKLREQKNSERFSMLHKRMLTEHGKTRVATV